ncbi:unnamed protein product [Urochloa humidicola]
MEASGGGIHCLCQDALADIFSRLPSESVFRCGAVCKSWRRITTDRSFQAAHAARRPREMLIVTSSLTVSAIPLTLTLAPARRRFLCDPAERHKNGTATWSKLLCSLHGLLVFQQRPGLYAICNPITRQWTNLPVLAPDPCFTAFPCGFYFHGSSGEYRLLCHGDEASPSPGWKDYYYVLAAGATRPRRLSRAPADRPRVYQRPVAHGEILYWSSTHPQADRTGKMLAFHTASETFRLMSGPPGATMPQLLELDGSLCAQSMPCATRLHIWALQDHEAERWTLRLRMEVPPLRSPWVVTTAISAGDGSILLIGDPLCPVVMLFDVKQKKLVKEMHFRSTPSFIAFSESLVSHAFFRLPRCPELKPLKFPGEPMTPQNVTPNVLLNRGKDSIISDSNNIKNPMAIEFGEFNIHVKHGKKAEEMSQAVSSSVLPCNLIFKGIDLLKKEEKAKKYINIGSMAVEIG